MTRKDWDRIRESADLLELGEKATLAEIKKAYRRLSKKHHPDMRKKGSKQDTEKLVMQKLNEAYQALLCYCGEFSFPLIQGKNEELEGEDWWFERFGQDHHWGRGSAPHEENGE